MSSEKLMPNYWRQSRCEFWMWRAFSEIIREADIDGTKKCFDFKSTESGSPDEKESKPRSHSTPHRIMALSRTKTNVLSASRLLFFLTARSISIILSFVQFNTINKSSKSNQKAINFMFATCEISCFQFSL